mmetsp:Transcript_9414/g.27659  ORF Transcript_9414/g.27659 Transcript_9414/m.27659 type:complete len:889 (-) Transcript_9414:293-2959(-)
MSSRTARPGGSDSRFFSTSKKGETHELRQELNSQNREKKVDAVKKVIANLTVGKDMSKLFTDVVNCIQTNNIELKKLVYLYLINYAKSQPDLALLAVNTFVRDAADANPLIRALAIRTMGCIRVERITEYLLEPLTRALRDEDPYVRKTAAICVAKLYDISPELVQDRGFVDQLRELISDSNPTVVANSVAALTEIAESADTDVMLVTPTVLQKLLAALNECTEWGQVFILDSLAKYEPQSSREAESIVERVTPRLQHANSAVVMSAVKVILSYMDHVTNNEAIRMLGRKLAPPLVTLINSEPEVQYVALRNINLIVQKRPKILEHEIKVFFCKYNDPIYVKLEKLEIMIRLVNQTNIDQVLLEFKEYATEVDVDFVRRSVRAIGRCAIKLERAAQRCISVLLELIETGVNYVVQEAIIVIKDIFRRYPNRYEQIIATLCENLETLDEPEAKASMVWIIGEYAERIDNADELMETFLETFDEETAAVQLQLLTATVKLFLKNPEETQELVQRVLTMATEESDNPDLRDRGFIYWRLLSTNPDAARAVVLAEKPTIADDTFTLEPGLLDEMITELATLSSVYHKPPEAFVVRTVVPFGDDEEEYDDEVEETLEAGVAAGEVKDEPVDLLGMDAPAAPAAADPFGLSAPAAPAASKLVAVHDGSEGGIAIQASFEGTPNGPVLNLVFTNVGAPPSQALAVQFNNNTFGVTPRSGQSAQLPLPQPCVQGGGPVSFQLPITCAPQMVRRATPTLDIQAALKNMASNAVVYFTLKLDLSAIFAPRPMDRDTFIATWKKIPDTAETSAMVDTQATADAIKDVLTSKNVYHVFRIDVPNAPGQQADYYSATTMTNVQLLVEIKSSPTIPQVKVAVRTAAQAFAEIGRSSIESLLR